MELVELDFESRYGRTLILLMELQLCLSPQMPNRIDCPQRALPALARDLDNIEFGVPSLQFDVYFKNFLI